jgi:archaellum component FlaC
MPKAALLKKIQEIKKRIFKISMDEFESSMTTFDSNIDFTLYHKDTNRSITIYHWLSKEIFYPNAHPTKYLGGTEPYRELKKWYKVLSGRSDRQWIGKQLVRSYLEDLDKKLLEYIASIDIDTSMIMQEQWDLHVLDGEFPYCYPYDKENSCKIKIEFFSTIPESLNKKVNDFEHKDDIELKISRDFLVNNHQIDLQINKRNPEERYSILAEKRKDNVIAALKSLGKLGSEKNRKNYLFDTQRTEKLNSEHESEINEVLESAMSKLNNLSSLYPAIAKEWHPTKNQELVPRNFSRGSNRKVWWTCKKGHEYQTAISNRTKGRGCPQCNPNQLTVQRKKKNEKDRLMDVINTQGQTIQELKEMINQLNKSIKDLKIK